MHLLSTLKVPTPFIATLSFVAVLGLSCSCRAETPDRATRAAEIFDSLCLSTSPTFSDIDRRATQARYQVVVDQTLPMPNDQTVRQKNWLVPSSDGAPTMITTNDGVNGRLHVVVCGIYTPDVESAEGNFAPRLLTEPYVTVSRHTALDHALVARSKYQWANSVGLSRRAWFNFRSACRTEIRYFDFIHLSNRDCSALHSR